MKASLRFAAIACGLMPLVLAPSSAQANEYDRCVRDLQNSNISADLIASSCAYVLHPDELGSCVNRIDNRTDIPAADALKTCRQARRPIETANCVISITRLGPVDGDAVLDYCRRSLLPERFARCVSALNGRANITDTVAVMGQCIDGRDRPRDMYPEYPRSGR
jgi:hypothetical protein